MLVRQRRGRKQRALEGTGGAGACLPSLPCGAEGQTLLGFYLLSCPVDPVDRQMFLATWKDIPNENEAQFQIRDCPLNTGESLPTRIPPTVSPVPTDVGLPSMSDPAEAASSKLQSSNIFTVAKRTVEGQDMLYQSLKLTNGIWVLAELRIQPGNPSFTVRTPVPTARSTSLPWQGFPNQPPSALLGDWDGCHCAKVSLSPV